ncbi:MAG TPA: hypothetical protein VFN61_14440 [Acidimicrobiales bacterium]|nr:hypothetical protein [Acidimicrobiales bacterium]
MAENKPKDRATGTDRARVVPPGPTGAGRAASPGRGVASIEEMLVTARLERTRPDPRHQRSLLNLAGENIAGAQRAIEVSPSLALTGAYDAIRHCVDAHLNANGLRAKSGDGSHRSRVEYARAAMSGIVSEHDLKKYQAARQIRHEAEYPSPERPLHLLPTDAQEMLTLAVTFHKAVSQCLKDSN